MTKPKRDEEGKLPRVTKTCSVFLDCDDGKRFPAGEFTITEIAPGPKIDQFADEAYKAARASLCKLMPHRYKLVVVDSEGAESRYGLDRWVKLVDGSRQLDEEAPGGRKQRIRRGKLAA